MKVAIKTYHQSQKSKNSTFNFFIFSQLLMPIELEMTDE